MTTSKETATYTTDEGVPEEVHELVRDTQPRRFALCEVEEYDEDGEWDPHPRIYAWGLDFTKSDGEGAMLVGDSDWHGEFTCAESALSLFSRIRALYLAWL